jgi:galacturan 1,4-alpha-galacturonidase
MPPLQIIFLLLLFFLEDLCAGLASSIAHKSSKHICVVQPSLTGGDDAPAIIAAFRNCGQGGNVIFTNHTYYINSVMNTAGLSNCHIELCGTLLVCILISIFEVFTGKLKTYLTLH